MMDTMVITVGGNGSDGGGRHRFSLHDDGLVNMMTVFLRFLHDDDGGSMFFRDFFEAELGRRGENRGLIIMGRVVFKIVVNVGTR